MEAMNRIIDNLTQTMNSVSSGQNCPYCKVFIPAIEVEILGKTRHVQPVCKCVQREQERFLERAADHQQRRETEKLFSITDLGERYERAGFDDFVSRPGAETAFRLAKDYVERFTEFVNLSYMIWGEPGNGKTHLAAAVANELTKLGHIVVFVSMPDLLQKIRATFNRDSAESEAQIMKALHSCDLLILDDIGAEKCNGWVQEVLFRIIDGRYRRYRPIFVTSNLTPKLLIEQIGKRPYDRLVEVSQLVENKATSYRREIAKQRAQQLKSG